MSRNREDGAEAPPSLPALLGQAWRTDRRRLLIVSGALLVGLLVTLVLGLLPGLTAAAPESIVVGKAAPLDVVAVRKASYVDEKATAIRIDAQARLTLAIFEMDPKASRAALDRYGDFKELVGSLAQAKLGKDTAYLRVQREFPGLFGRQGFEAILGSPSREQELADAEAILARILDRGIVSLPAAGLERFSADYLELRRSAGPMQEGVEQRYADITTLEGLDARIRDEEAQRRVARSSQARVADLVAKFAVENAFFAADASERRLEAAVRQVPPVTRSIAPGERILRKGTVITEADYAKYLAARAALSRPDWARIVGDGAYLLALSLLALFLLGRGISGSRLDEGETLLAALGLLLSWLLALFLSDQSLPGEGSYVAFLVPGALLCIVFAVFSGRRFALLYGLVLALLVLEASDYDPRAFLYSLLASSAAAFAVSRAESRMDLVRAGLRLALMEAGGAALLSLPFAGELRGALLPLAYGGANGIVSALLALGAFPVLEQLLNAATRFRLIELSDLNAPALQRLLAVAPGTYSHSVAVAHLAEAACREIGADPLLARVGAYYHDIGKAEQPEYFVENQAGYNSHDEINPRLSATVIRSHVRIGVEKARALGLPDEVVAIVAEHHGNGLISWFFDRANREEEADPEDFSYPGRPPASREAAVIMLADAAEAAARTLKKPSPARIDALLKELFLDRFRQGQLDRSDLTFRDLETIRASFTRILTGQHHARIEYPRSKEGGR